MSRDSLFPSASVQGRLDELLDEIKALRKDQAESAAVREALDRFEFTGETAPPMSTKQVAHVLNTTTNAVDQLVFHKQLRRRFGDRGFLPDDVRAYLNTRSKTGGVKSDDELREAERVDGGSSGRSAEPVRGIRVHTATVPRGV